MVEQQITQEDDVYERMVLGYRYTVLVRIPIQLLAVLEEMDNFYEK